MNERNNRNDEKKETNKSDPLNLCFSITKILFLLVLWFYWILTSSEPIGIILFLGLVIFLLCQHFYPEIGNLTLLEALFVGSIAFYLPHFAVAFAIPLFEGIYYNKIKLLIPGGVLAIIRWDFSPQGALIFLIAGILGCFFRIAINERNFYRRESDLERKKRYEAEHINTELSTLREEMFHITQLSERNRIAQSLHDDVGHELTGAVLGLQALSSMLEKQNLTDQELNIYEQVEQRVNRSAKALRDTVHKIKPLIPLDLESLQDMIDEYSHLPITFKFYGNPENVPVYYWVLLNRALKEGLTNIMRHSNAKEIVLKLDVTSKILRFQLENDGLNLNEKMREMSQSKKKQKDFNYSLEKDFTEGIGLRSLRQRTKAYGGFFSAVKLTDTNRFRLVLVFPLREEKTK